MSTPAGTAVEPTPGQQLRRLHPLTPLLRSWRLIAGAFAVAYGATGGDMDKFRWAWDAAHGDLELGALAKAALLLAGIAVVAVVTSWLSWRVSWFAIVPDAAGASTLLYHRGLVVKQRSQIRLSRVQAVDVNQSLIARVAGLASVRLDMAAGEGASVDLAYLREVEAWALRLEILQHTTRAPVDRHALASSPTPDQLVAKVATSLLVYAALLDGILGWIVLVVWLFSLVAVGVIWGSTALLAGMSGIIPVTLVILADLRKQAKIVLADANFVLWRTPHGIRTSSGLTSTANKTIDHDRIQGVRMEEPFLWRRLGWARVKVDVAGAKGDGQHAASLMPVTTRLAALALVKDVTGVDLDASPYAAAGSGARVLDPLGYRFLGVSMLAHGAIRRSGRWRRSTSYVPFARVQSVTAHQGIAQRRLGLATVYLDLPKGSERWTARHRPADTAAALVTQVARLAREHRAIETRRPSTTPAPLTAPPPAT